MSPSCLAKTCRRERLAPHELAEPVAPPPLPVSALGQVAVHRSDPLRHRLRQRHNDLLPVPEQRLPKPVRQSVRAFAAGKRYRLGHRERPQVGRDAGETGQLLPPRVVRLAPEEPAQRLRIEVDPSLRLQRLVARCRVSIVRHKVFHAREPVPDVPLVIQAMEAGQLVVEAQDVRLAVPVEVQAALKVRSAHEVGRSPFPHGRERPGPVSPNVAVHGSASMAACSPLLSGTIPRKNTSTTLACIHPSGKLNRASSSPPS